jgi:hypothetical protein
MTISEVPMRIKVFALVGLGLCVLTASVYAASTAAPSAVKSSICPVCRLLGL